MMKRELRDLNEKEIVILSLYSLFKQSCKQVDEGGLHRVVYSVQRYIPMKYKFFTQPIIFSYDLLRDVEELRSDGFVDTIIEVIDESIPRYSYKLTLMGIARAENILDSLSEESRKSIERVLARGMDMAIL